MAEHKMIVTHSFPDVDAVMAVWLVKRFAGKRWEEAQVKLVAHGQTLGGKHPDSNEDVIHVDTGGGRFDHHSANERTCAAAKVLKWLQKDDEALVRMTEYATAIDHFEDVAWHDPLGDLYDFGFAEMLAGVKSAGLPDHELIDWAMSALDGVYYSLRTKVTAIGQVKEVGAEIPTRFGAALVIQSFNDEVIRVAMKMGYILVMRRDPQKKYVRIKAHPKSEIDLTYLYQKLVALDPEATWYLHADKKQLLNGNSADKQRVVTELDYDVLVDVLKNI